MERLVEIIGPAPSELPWEDALHRVMKERERVRGELEWFRTGGAVKGRGSPKGRKAATKVQKKKAFVHKMDAFSGDPDILLEMMKKAMEEAEGNGQ